MEREKAEDGFAESSREVKELRRSNPSFAVSSQILCLLIFVS